MSEKKFETCFSRLEQIVEKLDVEELPLEESLKLYEEGVKLSRFCSKKLEEAEKKIQRLARDSSGLLFTEDLEETDPEPKDETP